MTAPTIQQPDPQQGFDPEYEEESYAGLGVEMNLRLVYDGYAMEAKIHCAIEDMPGVLLELKTMGIEGANTPLLWPKDKPQHAVAPQQQAPPPQPQPVPQPQAQPQATGWDANGNTTYAQQAPAAPQGAPPSVPTRYDPDGTPYCPHHNERMAVSKFGGWYCQKQGGPQPNARGYCSYSFKGA